MLKFKNVPFLSSVEIIRDLRGRKLQPSFSIDPPGQRGSGLQRRDGLGPWQVDRGPQRRCQTRRRRHLAAAARNFSFQIFLPMFIFQPQRKTRSLLFFIDFFKKMMFLTWFVSSSDDSFIQFHSPLSQIYNMELNFLVSKIQTNVVSLFSSCLQMIMFSRNLSATSCLLSHAAAL